MSARILILSLVFPPDGVSTARIMGDVAVDLSARGHDVAVVTTTPHYNRDPDAEAEQPLAPVWGRLLQRSTYHGIPVYHTLMPVKGRSVAGRVAAWTGFHFLSVVTAVVKMERPDVILVPSPPLTIGLAAALLKILRRAPYVYNVQEIYPDIAVSLGLVRNRALIGALTRLERFVYRQAAAVTVIAPRMRHRLLEKGVPPSKVHVLPNFVDLSSIREVEKDNEFARRLGLEGRFVVNYAGNLGAAQDIGAIVEAAHLLRGHENIHFVLMGDGIQREEVFARVAQLRLEHVHCLTYQPHSVMSQAYSASDVCLVPQSADTGCDAVPSKVYRIMGCARPVLAATEAQSDLGALIRESGAGVVIAPGSPDRYAETILAASRDREGWQRMGRAGRRHVEEHYQRSVVTRRYAELLEAVAASRGLPA